MKQYIKKIVKPFLTEPIIKNFENLDLCFYRDMLGYQNNDSEVAKKITNGITNEIREIECYSDNFNSWVYTYNNKTHQTSHDHKTGG
tara:strand:+ start:242 stop:502 length:261 start_codon:yes stop_codon:yes gene_type:complete